jgi:hypothetical protein
VDAAHQWLWEWRWVCLALCFTLILRIWVVELFSTSAVVCKGSVALKFSAVETMLVSYSAMCDASAKKVVSSMAVALKISSPPV